MHSGAGGTVGTWLVSFAQPGTEASRRALVESALERAGFRGSFEWDQGRLESLRFFRDHPRLLDRRLDALELWKPAVILEQLQAVPAGDLILYHDVGQGYWGDYAFEGSLAPLFDWVLGHGGLLPGVWVPEEGRSARWTTRACFRTLGCDSPAHWESPQLQTVYSVWQHGDRAIDLLQGWLAACATVYDRPEPAEAENFPDFVRDRGARSVLTCLAVSRGITTYGQPYESTVEINHPDFPPVPASDIGNLLTRIESERRLSASARAPAEPPGGSSGRLALFTSIPPTLDRRSVDGIAIGPQYQARCVASWKRCGFEVYSVHFQDELDTLKRIDGVTYVGAERTPDDSPADRKPSLRAILQVMQSVEADLSGLVNSDIFLLDAPGWVETVRREVEDSVVVFTRYETNDIDRTIIGWAPWGFDLLFFDRRYIAGLAYCGMRIGESWWDYWLPLWLYFGGATIKHVADCVALHLDHPVVSNTQMAAHGLRFYDLLTRTAEAERAEGRTTRLTAFHDYCTYRMKAEAQRLKLSDPRSLEFVGMVLNNTVWAGIRRLLRHRRIQAVASGDPHYALLAEVLLRTAQAAERTRKETDRRRAAAEAAPAALVREANRILNSWPYQADFRLSNAVRRLRGKPPKNLPPVTDAGEAIHLVRQLRRRLVWRALAPFSPAAGSIWVRFWGLGL